jgi:hypothetical protein
MNDIRISEARNTRRVQLDYLGSAISLCVLTALACIAVYLITIVR